MHVVMLQINHQVKHDVIDSNSNPNTPVNGSSALMGNGYDGQVTMQFKTNPQCYFNHGSCSFITTSTLDAMV
jgi:hypothetical protein